MILCGWYLIIPFSISLDYHKCSSYDGFMPKKNDGKEVT